MSKITPNLNGTKNVSIGSNIIFTPTQQRMLKVLDDGLPHTKEELHACLVDELGSLNNIWAHITAIRKKIQPHGHDIVFRNNYYRIVRMLASPYEE